MGSCMGTERSVPRVGIGRPYCPNLEAYHGTRMGMCTGFGGASPHYLLGDVGDRKAGEDRQWQRVTWLACLDRG